MIILFCLLYQEYFLRYEPTISYMIFIFRFYRACHTFFSSLFLILHYICISKYSHNSTYPSLSSFVSCRAQMSLLCPHISFPISRSLILRAFMFQVATLILVFEVSIFFSRLCRYSLFKIKFEIVETKCKKFKT